MLRLDEQFSAKVLKRVGQLRRLGARGLLRTAYVRTAGPAVYSLTEPARAIAASLHRQRAVTRALPVRLERLKQRVSGDLGAAIGGVGVRRAFAAAGRVVQTLEATLDLAAAGCAVQPVVAVDWAERAITLAAVAGQRFRDCSQGQREELLDRLEGALIAIHRAGFVLGEIGEDSVLFSGESHQSIVVDLSRALPLAGLSRDMSIHLRDADRRAFNKLFGTRLLTAAQLRNLLSPSAGIPRDELHGLAEVYAPVVIRDDIRWGKIWNTDLGIGRWNFIMKEHLPIPVGGRVLDLGSNNGFNPLQMLRAGAASAVGIEIHEPAVEQAKFLKSAYEWLDNRPYDFRCIHASQGDLPMLDLARFDAVTAFCSLYYLPEPDIRALVRFIRSRTNMLVLQCNTDRLIDRGGDEETFRKASVEFALEMMEQAGFTDRRVIAPPGYSRPLVIGRP